MITIALILLAVIGLFLLHRGFRGRRIDDHPLCRRCGFDLTGRPETSTACSECGSDIAKPMAIVVGHRAKRRPSLWLGTAVLLIATLAISGLWWTRANNFNWIEHEPVWWLIYRAKANSGVATPELAELQRRLGCQLLSDAETGRFIDAALDIASDPAKPWNYQWDASVTTAIYLNFLSESQQRRAASLLLNSYALDVRVRSPINLNDPLPYQARCFYNPRLPIKPPGWKGGDTDAPIDITKSLSVDGIAGNDRMDYLEQRA